jgi:hypothetical protein
LIDEQLIDDAIKVEVDLDTLPPLYNYEPVKMTTPPPPVSLLVVP